MLSVSGNSTYLLALTPRLRPRPTRVTLLGLLLLVGACSGRPLSPGNNNSLNNNNSTPLCGDGVAQAPEQCDTYDLQGQTCLSIGQGFSGGTLACEADCTWDTSACLSSAVCGDGVAQAPEQCDTYDLQGQTCLSIGQGFSGGTLACEADCTWDTSACTGGCPATDLGTWSGVTITRSMDTCFGSTAYSPPNGSASCTGYNAPGQEVLYSITLGPGESVTVAYQPASGADGSLYALTDCNDTAATTCVAGSDEIGDGVSESILVHNPAFSMQTFYLVLDNFSGCGSSTLTISSGTTCGDNVRQQGELCDGADLGGETCTSIGQGFTGGTLACASSFFLRRMGHHGVYEPCVRQQRGRGFRALRRRRPRR